MKEKKQGKMFTRAERLDAFKVFCKTDSIEETSKITGINKETLKKWRRIEDWDNKINTSLARVSSDLFSDDESVDRVIEELGRSNLNSLSLINPNSLPSSVKTFEEFNVDSIHENDLENLSRNLFRKEVMNNKLLEAKIDNALSNPNIEIRNIKDLLLVLKHIGESNDRIEKRLKDLFKQERVDGVINAKYKVQHIDAKKEEKEDEFFFKQEDEE